MAGVMQCSLQIALLRAFDKSREMVQGHGDSYTKWHESAPCRVVQPGHSCHICAPLTSRCPQADAAPVEHLCAVQAAI